MKRTYLTIVLFAAGSLPAVAQRLDGCLDRETPFPPPGTTLRAVARETQDRGLQEAGYGRTPAGLVIALSDPRADIRSLAALKLGEIGRNEDLPRLMAAWLAEGDTCTKGKMGLALSMLAPELAFDARQHPGGQPRVTPFKACAASRPPLVTLVIEQVIEAGISRPEVRISARNQTPRALAFLGSTSPADVFSVTVLGPTGEPAKVTKGQEWMYQPVRDIAHMIGKGITFVPLPPQEDVLLWTWNLGEDFDITQPGTFTVSLGGRLAYLDTTVCSNTAEIKVGN